MNTPPWKNVRQNREVKLVLKKSTPESSLQRSSVVLGQIQSFWTLGGSQHQAPQPLLSQSVVNLADLWPQLTSKFGKVTENSNYCNPTAPSQCHNTCVNLDICYGWSLWVWHILKSRTQEHRLQPDTSYGCVCGNGKYHGVPSISSCVFNSQTLDPKALIPEAVGAIQQVSCARGSTEGSTTRAYFSLINNGNANCCKRVNSC